MSERGFTVLETLLAAAVLGFVMLGVGLFYVSSVRMEQENNAQIYLQRQATLIINEMTKQIGEATASSIVIPCSGGGTPDSIEVTNSRGTYCFHRDGAGSGLLEDRPGGQWDLLRLGSPARLTTTTGACPDEGGFCPTLVVDNNKPSPCGGPSQPSCNRVGAAITFRLRFQLPESSGYQTMTFTTTIAARN